MSHSDDPNTVQSFEESAPSDFSTSQPGEKTTTAEQRQKKWLLGALAGLLIVFLLVSGLFYRYLRKPAPLPELVVPQANLDYAPHYLFSIFGVDHPVGVAISADGNRIYAAEAEGQRLVRIFDRDGALLGSLAPPNTSVGERAPVYLAADRQGRVWVSDRMQHAVFIYDREGRYLDTLLAAAQTLSGLVARQTSGQIAGVSFAYNLYRGSIYYQRAGSVEERLPIPDDQIWSPLGVRIDAEQRIYLTDVTKDYNCIYVLKLGSLATATSWVEFNPQIVEFGASGQGNGQFLFPNSATSDSRGRIYISDGNNGRIAVWDQSKNFLFNFGGGSTDGSVNLPRGIFIDKHDRLHVVDAVGQMVNVYDVSESEPAYLYSFGEFGSNAGQFNFPNDIVIDDSGRLYIADRENNRIQVWSY
jgi:sugar lactone lactonase YvrE